MQRVPAAALILAFCGVALVSAQQAPSFRSGSDTVSVYATVLDRTGRLVPGLGREDFEIFDNGKRQDITVFANDLQPITIVVMLDRSGSMVRHFDLVRKAAERFVSELEPNDRARVGSFSNRIRIDPDEFTGDQEELHKILRTRLLDPGTTPLWRATSIAMNALADEPGRRVVLLFTDGHDTPDAQGNNVPFREVRDRSVAENIMVYGIGLTSGCSGIGGYSLPWPSAPRFQRRMPRPGGQLPPIMRPPRPMPPIMGPDVVRRPAPDPPTCMEMGPDPNLRQLAHVGGGGYFELRDGKELDETFARVADELHQQYLLAFTPQVLDGEVHSIEVRVKDSALTARARQSYLAAQVGD